MSEAGLHSGFSLRSRTRAAGAVAAAVLMAGACLATVRWGGPDDPTELTAPFPARATTPSPVTPLGYDALLGDATFAVPAYPAPWDASCPAGTRQFHSGHAVVSDRASLVMGEGPASRGDLDGASGDEVVVRLRCQVENASDLNLLALRPRPDGTLQALGWVNLDADGGLLRIDPVEPVSIADGTIRVSVLGRVDDDQLRADKQIRGYAFRDAVMTQVSGPTRFRPDPTDIRSVDLRNATLALDLSHGGTVDGYAGYVRTNDGVGTATFEKIVNNRHTGPVSVTVTVGPTAIGTAAGRDLAVAAIDVRPADGTAFTVVVAFHADAYAGYAARDVAVVTRDTGPVLGLVADPDRITVTVAGARAGTRTFIFGGDPANPRWIETP